MQAATEANTKPLTLISMANQYQAKNSDALSLESYGDLYHFMNKRAWATDKTVQSSS